MLQRTSRPFTLLLGMQSTLPPLSIDVSLPALPMLGAALGTSSGAAQWTLSAFLLGFAFGQLLLGPLSDRLGRRPVLVAGLAVYALAGVAAAVSPSISALVFWRLLQGFGACSGVVISRAVLRDVFEGAEAVSRQSFLGAAATLAMLLAPAIGAALLESFDWRAIYGLLAAAGMALLAATALLQPETLATGRRRAQGAWQAYAEVLHVRRSLGYAALNALTFGGLFAYIAASPGVFIDGLGVSPAGYSLIFALVALALLAGSVLNGALARRVTRELLERLGPAVLCAALVLVCVVGPLLPNVPVLVCVLAAFTFANGIVAPNAIAGALAPVPHAAGAMAAVIGFSQMIVGALSATLVGLVGPGTVPGMIAVIAVFGTAALAIVLWMELTRPGRWRGPPNG